MSAALRRGRNACPTGKGLTVHRVQDLGDRLQEVSSLARAETPRGPTRTEVAMSAALRHGWFSVPASYRRHSPLTGRERRVGCPTGGK